MDFFSLFNIKTKKESLKDRVNFLHEEYFEIKNDLDDVKMKEESLNDKVDFLYKKYYEIKNILKNQND